MTINLVRLALGATLIVTAGCNSGVEPKPDVQIRVDGQASIVMTSSSGGSVAFDVPIAIDNNADAVLSYMPCATSLERRIDGAWQQVWAYMCSLTGHEVTIAGRSSATVTMKVRATRTSLPLSFPLGSVQGEYRFRMLLISDKATMRPGVLVTPVFRLE